MTKRISKLHSYLLFFAIAFCSMFLLHPTTVKAVTINVNDTTDLINEGANGKTHSLVGQYTLKEIGATNFSQDANGGSAKIINTMKGKRQFFIGYKKDRFGQKNVAEQFHCKINCNK